MKFGVIVKSSLPKKENKKNIIAILFVLKQKKCVVIIASDCVFVPNLSYVFLLQVFKAGEEKH